MSSTTTERLTALKARLTLTQTTVNSIIEAGWEEMSHNDITQTKLRLDTLAQLEKDIIAEIDQLEGVSSDSGRQLEYMVPHL